MKKSLIILTLIASQTAQAALYCENPVKCASKAISLVKKAAKAGCTAEAEAIAGSIHEFMATGEPGGQARQLVYNAEICIERGKIEKRAEKASGKLDARLKNALNGK